jgi:glycosyltransferase involved in cell wall biosynthesis
MSPFFSIILPTYNRANFISKAIDSVLNQTLQDFELIIIDDGSTDDTHTTVSSYLTDDRIKYIYQKNQERSVARNNGINHSKGQYICFLDSDDYYLPNHLSVLYNCIEKNNYAVALFHTYQTYIKDGVEQKNSFFDNYKNDKFNDCDLRLINNVWLFSPAVQTIAVHKKIVSDILFDVFPVYTSECYHFIGKIAAVHNVIKINEFTVVMLQHENNSTSYDIKFLEGSLQSFKFILKEPIYKNIARHFSVKNKFYIIYIGIADNYSKSKNKITSIKYLVKAIACKTDFNNLRQLLGVIKNIIFK